MGVLKKYRLSKSIKKGAEPTVIVTAIAMIATIILKAKKIDVSEEELIAVITGIVAGASGLYGAWKAVRNWMKNRD